MEPKPAGWQARYGAAFEERDVVARYHLRPPYPQEVIDAVAGHATFLGVPRETRMAKTLYAVDELSGFIAACALVRPTGIHGMKPKSVKKKLGQPSFAAAANLAQMAMGVTDIVMVGRLGAVPLAAAGLGAMLYFTGGVMLQGILSAVAPLAAHALGAGDRAATGPIAGAGLVLALMLALPFVAVLTSLDRLLHLLGYDAALAAEIGRFLRAIAWGGRTAEIRHRNGWALQ